MRPQDPNVGSVELVADALGELRNELVLVGGCAVGLLITDLGRPPIRETQDVDLVAEVLTLPSYYELEQKLREKGFRESGDVICRWEKDGLIVDVMSSVEIGHNFTNRWYPLAVQHSQRLALPSGVEIRMVTAPLFLATKLESFLSRAGGNYEHHDMEDIVNLVDGRIELLDEVEQLDPQVREFIMDEIDGLLSDSQFTEKLPWLLNPDPNNQARVELLLGRFRVLAGL